ncbi:MAG: CHRD domain-containing protein [Fimbriimonadaceae bacterium]|nr:CHRD domain-containing protein [Fimbriimonadaceae bacterium]
MISRNILPLVLMALGATQASAFVWTIDDPMDGLQEVPPNASPATGTIVGTYDDVSNLLDITVTFSGLLAAQTNAHIHRGAVGVAGPVVFPLPLGSPSVFSTTLDATQESDLLAGLYYVNIHSQAFPGGEIRGQMNPVPEPATMLALGGGLAVLLRRRKN